MSSLNNENIQEQPQNSQSSIIDNELYLLIQDNFSSATKKKPILVNSYKELCSLLKLNYSSHSSQKKAQEEELKNYMRFTKKGNKYNITSVIPLEDCIKNKTQSILSNSASYNLYSFLNYYYEETGETTLVATPTELAESIGLISNKYKETRDSQQKQKELSLSADNKLLKANLSRHPEFKSTKEQILKDREGKEETEYTPSYIAKNELNKALTNSRLSYNRKIAKELDYLHKNQLIIQNEYYIGIYLINSNQEGINKEIGEVIYNNPTSEDILTLAKRLSNTYGYDYDEMLIDINSGKITKEDLIYIEMEEKNIGSLYLIKNRILNEKETGQLLNINFLVNQKTENLPIDLKLKKQEAIKKWRLKVDLQLEMVYYVHSLSFSTEAIKYQKQYYQDKILLGKSINKSTAQLNKEFLDFLVENRKEAIDNPKERIRLEHLKYYTHEDLKETSKFYAEYLISELVKIDPQNLSASQDLSVSQNSPASQNSPTSTSPLSLLGIDITWKKVCENSKKRLENTRDYNHNSTNPI